MTFTLLAVAGWMIAALAFTAGWATHARLSFRPRALAAASSQPPLRAAPAGPNPAIQTRRHKLSLRASLRLHRHPTSSATQELR